MLSMLLRAHHEHVYAKRVAASREGKGANGVCRWRGAMEGGSNCGIDGEETSTSGSRLGADVGCRSRRRRWASSMGEGKAGGSLP
jgi:hypothetical protein